MFNIKRSRTYLRVSNMLQIARRYLVLNGFDGLYTMLGIIIGSYVSGHHTSGVVLGAGLAGVMALGFSGVSSAYLAEKAERTRKLRDLERAMLADLSGTVQEEAVEFASIFTALVNGFSPVLAAFIMLSPFFAAHLGLVSVEAAFPLAIIVGSFEVFFLGYYLGGISGGGRLSYGLRMLLIAGATALVSYVVGTIFG
ncbi:MAG: hypothetical protein ABH851_07810 [Methanobacteriota archaeon]